MIQAEYRLKLGQDEFIIKAECKNEKDFFQKMAFYSSLPKTAPGGATDLKLVVRETAKGTYYSLISEQEKLEFKLGQHKEGDTLYAKGWEPLYQKDDEGQSQQASAPAFGTQQQAAPAQQAAPPFNGQFPGMVNPTTGPTAQTQAAPAPAFGAGQMPVPQTVAAPAAAPTPAAAAPAAAPAAATPQVQAVANSVLSRFGIKQG